MSSFRSRSKSTECCSGGAGIWYLVERGCLHLEALQSQLNVVLGVQVSGILLSGDVFI